jgi:hypothetical protein
VSWLLNCCRPKNVFKAAKEYTFKSSTNVLFADEWVPLDVATDREKMESFPPDKLSREEV